MYSHLTLLHKFPSQFHWLHRQPAQEETSLGTRFVWSGTFSHIVYTLTLFGRTHIYAAISQSPPDLSSNMHNASCATIKKSSNSSHYTEMFFSSSFFPWENIIAGHSYFISTSQVFQFHHAICFISSCRVSSQSLCLPAETNMAEPLLWLARSLVWVSEQPKWQLNCEFNTNNSTSTSWRLNKMEGVSVYLYVFSDRLHIWRVLFQRTQDGSVSSV